MQFTPTIDHCSLATLIGLCIRTQLMRKLPATYKIDISVRCDLLQLYAQAKCADLPCRALKAVLFLWRHVPIYVCADYGGRARF